MGATCIPLMAEYFFSRRILSGAARIPLMAEYFTKCEYTVVFEGYITFHITAV